MPCNLAGDAPPWVLNAQRLIARSSLLLLGGQESVRLLALFVEFAIDLALTGNLTHAFDQVAARRKDEQIDQEATENLFWD